jgi:type II secretory ATPase GspE/PulE/Tfp pilus assembly ATPase PilB-like protein
MAVSLGRSWFEIEEMLGGVVLSEVQADGSRKEWGELETVLGGIRDRAGLDAAWCQNQGVQPLAERDGTLHLIAVDAADPKAGEQARQRSGKAVILHPGTRSLRERIATAFSVGIATPHDAGPLADLAGLAEMTDLADLAAPVEVSASVAAKNSAAPVLETLGGAAKQESLGGSSADLGMSGGLDAGLDAGLGGMDAGLGGSLGGGSDFGSDFGAGDHHGGDLEEYDDVVDVDLRRPLPPGPEAQVLRLVNHVLSEGVRLGASDLHLEPYENDVRIRFRIDGKLGEFETPPKHLFPQMISRLKILAKMDIAEKRVPQDGGIMMRDGKSRIDLRASTVPTCYGEKMVLRILDKDGIPDNMEFLGLSDQQAHDFIEAANAHHGLMFVTGPTGSGKSTTLYCALNLTNTPDKNIVTVEDPVEFKFHGLNQVPIRANAGMTFAGALRAFLRQDPDVIMVGEVRDAETAAICMRAALTGHLVLSTLHTNSALQVVTRLTDMGIEPFLLGPALRLIEAQRLVRRLCTECKVQMEMPPDVAKRHGMQAGEILFVPGERPDCAKCGGSGYKGRVGIYEVVPIDETLQEMIGKGESERKLTNVVRERGIDLIPDSAVKKLREGITSLHEVSDYIRDGLKE